MPQLLRRHVGVELTLLMALLEELVHRTHRRRFAVGGHDAPEKGADLLDDPGLLIISLGGWGWGWNYSQYGTTEERLKTKCCHSAAGLESLRSLKSLKSSKRFQQFQKLHKLQGFQKS